LGDVVRHRPLPRTELFVELPIACGGDELLPVRSYRPPRLGATMLAVFDGVGRLALHAP